MVLIFSFVLFSLNFGCSTAKSTQRYRELSGKQKAQAEDWMHSANLLCKVNDYNFALGYYEKIIKYYPGTKYAEEAQSKIDEIEKKRK